MSNTHITIVPDQQALLNVERDHPNASNAEKFRLAQVDTLIRQCGGHMRKRGEHGKRKGDGSQKLNARRLKMSDHTMEEPDHHRGGVWRMTKRKDTLDSRQAVIQVGDGRGFIVEPVASDPGPINRRVVVTGAHCLPHLPPAHTFSYLEEKTYQKLLGLLDQEPTVWAEFLFVDPVADIAGSVVRTIRNSTSRRRPMTN